MKILNKILSYIVDIVLIIAIILVAYKIYIRNTYEVIENEYIDAARFIYEENGIQSGIEVSQIVLTRREINSLLTTPALRNDCNGYVIIYPSNQGPDYEAYINCSDKYQTKGYDSKKLD